MFRKRGEAFFYIFIVIKRSLVQFSPFLIDNGTEQTAVFFRATELLHYVFPVEFPDHISKIKNYILVFHNDLPVLIYSFSEQIYPDILYTKNYN